VLSSAKPPPPCASGTYNVVCGDCMRCCPLVLPLIMELYLSRSLMNTILRDTQGTPCYRIETSSKWLHKTTTVSKFGPRAGGGSSSRGETDIAPRHNAHASETDIHLMSLEEIKLVQIEWRRLRVGSTLFKFRDQTTDLDTYLPKDEFYGR
jgi:hypothetical protein